MLGWLRIIARSTGRHSLLHASQHFEAMLDRERSRADRSGAIFSVLALRLRPEHRQGGALHVVSQVLANRLRATDLTGFMSDGRIGILSPDTNIDGTRELAESLRQTLAANDIPLDYEIFTYPSDAFPGPPSFDSAGNAEEGEPESLGPIMCQQLPLWKRAFDILAASAGLIVLSPLFGVAALLIKWSSTGPVFFTQPRAGLGGKPFVLYKFRTMCVDAEIQKAELMHQNEQDGPAFKITHDPRITSIGRLLRKSCVDELPQLLNVLKGDMTIVGPRPLPCNESDRVEGWQRRRLDVTPGLTCTWQAGARRVTFADWARLDIRYARDRSLAKDIKLVWKTFLKVVLFRASS